MSRLTNLLSTFICIIGQFTSNADASLVMATHSVIASEFYDFEDSSWLFISFMLAAVATQSIVSTCAACLPR